MAKRASLLNLSDRLNAKPGAAEAEAPAKPPRRATRAPTQPDGRKGLPVRVSVETWKQLRRLAADRETTLQGLMTEALNDLFQKHGLPPIA